MRRLIGYRVVRERDGVREYEHYGWSPDPPTPYSDPADAYRVAHMFDARVVTVYLTVRRRRK